MSVSLIGCMSVTYIIDDDFKNNCKDFEKYGVNHSFESILSYALNNNIEITIGQDEADENLLLCECKIKGYTYDHLCKMSNNVDYLLSKYFKEITCVYRSLSTS